MSSAAGCGRSWRCCMWCAASRSSRYLAVNRGVRRQTVIRARFVPSAFRTLRIPLRRACSSHFGTERGRRLQLAPGIVRNPDAHPRQPPADHGRLDARRRSAHCAIGPRSSGRRTATDMCRCDPRKAPPPAGPAAVPRCHRIVPAAFARCHMLNLHCRACKPDVWVPRRKSIHTNKAEAHRLNAVSVWYRCSHRPDTSKLT